MWWLFPTQRGNSFSEIFPLRLAKGKGRQRLAGESRHFPVGLLSSRTP